MSTTVTTGQKCSKPAGQYCRLHNPAPKTQPLTSIEAVFQKFEETKQSKLQEPTFKNSTAVRTLSPSIPKDLEEHRAVSIKQADALGLDEYQRTALASFGGFAAGIVNSVTYGNEYDYYDEAPLWRTSDGPTDFSTREDLVDFMETLDSALEKRNDKSKIVYRGIPIYSSIHDAIEKEAGKRISPSDSKTIAEGLKKYYAIGKVFHHKAYVSTSVSAEVAAERTENSANTKQSYYDKPERVGIMFEMKTNAGVDITGLARPHYAYEREVVLPRDTYFKVVNVKINPEPYVVSSDNAKRSGDTTTFDKLACVVQLVEVDSKGNPLDNAKTHKPKQSAESLVN